MKSKKIFENIVSFLLSILLMGLVILSLVSCFFKNVFLNENYYLRILNNNNTENQVYESLNDELKYALLVSNIP